MSKYTVEERVWIVLKWEKYDGAFKKIQREFKQEFKKSSFPQKETMERLYEKFKRTGSVLDDNEARTGRPVTVRTESAIARVSEIVAANPGISTRRGAQEAGMSEWTFRKILKEDL